MQGDIETLEDSLVAGLSALSLEQCQGLCVKQIKKIRVLIDEAIVANKTKMDELEASRDAVLGEMSNWLHPSVPISKVRVDFFCGFKPIIWLQYVVFLKEIFFEM